MNVRLHVAFWLMLSAPFASKAAELKPDTVKAWDEHIRAVNLRMQERLRLNSRFLWVDEAEDRSQRVRRGEILVAPVGEQNPKHVHDGLVHHWMGAAFISNARIDDVLRIIRDYTRYKEFYKPSVIDSKRLGQIGAHDKFSMRMLNNAVLAKVALDSEYEITFVPVDEKRWYAMASATRVQEIQDFGQPGERELPPDQGHGYIWRLYSLFRLQERDGGVYVELEALALSRDIPVALRWIANPIVTRLSRSSLLTTLERTGEAVHSSVEVASVGHSSSGQLGIHLATTERSGPQASSLASSFRLF